MHVLLYRAAYFAAPASIVNIRDGGWHIPAGIATAAVCLAWFGWRHVPQRRALLASAAAAGLAWGIEVLALSLRPVGTQHLPQLELADLQGTKKQLADFRGKPVVINLWATWCPPSRREMPVLRAAQQRHPGIDFVFANQGELPAAIRKYLHAEKIELHKLLLDPTGSLPKQFKAYGLPITVFFDASGKQVGARSGKLSTGTLAQLLEQSGASLGD